MAAAVIVSLSAGSSVYGHGSEEMHARQKERSARLDMVEKSFGRTGDPRHVTRTIHINGDDSMRFTPSQITVKQGETIRFVVQNSGKTMHEAVLGTMADLKEHAELMRKFPGMEHEEPYMVHVAPGQSGEMIWQFTQAGEFFFGCLVAGHFEAGMLGRIQVAAR
jgi:uncharacterized cupredoxin-like copper-binding protein